MQINNKIKKYCILYTKNILEVYKLFEKNKINIAIVINKKQNFLGIVTPTDIRKAFIKGSTLKSKISNVFNKNPIFIKGEINTFKIKNIISKKNFININPPVIPLVNESGKPTGLIQKDKLTSLKKKINKKNILLLGGAGYIGSVLTEQLLKDNYNVTVYDKFIYLKKKKFEQIFNNKNLKCISGDSRNLEQIFDLIKKTDVVVHLAEMVGDPLCESRPEKTYTINYLASLSIASICKNLGVEKFIYISSCSVYGSNKDKKPLNESSEINPLSVYAKLKSICEEAIISNSGDFFKPCILRLGTVYGNSFRPRYDLVANLFSGLIANKQKIFIEGGDQWRPFICVSDVASIIRKIIKSPRNLTSGQIFNVVSENLKIKDIGEMISKTFPKSSIEIIEKKQDFRDYKVTASKAKKVLKFKPKVKMKDGIKEMIRFTLTNKIKNIKSKKYINILNSDKF